MNLAHVHLLLNHIPVLGTLFGLVLLGSALFVRNITVQRLSLLIFVGVALFALPVYFSGEPAEEIVEHLPGVAQSRIEQHEDAAKVAMVSIVLLGCVSFVGLAARTQAQVFRSLSLASLVLALLTAGLMVRTANWGGEIRHTEIGSGGATGVVGASDETNPEAKRSENERRDNAAERHRED